MINHSVLKSLVGMTASILLLGCASSSPPVAQVPATLSQASPLQTLPITAKVTFEDQVIQLEVAGTPEQQEIGLMNRPPLADDRGMLFPFEPPRPVIFWMKDTPSPLDIVFLLDGEVKAIAADAQPCAANPCPTYGSKESVNQVIELRSGRAEELGLQVGDRVSVEFLDRPSS
ncbi:MAG: DUF192 domain-containing protein [Timaviella obliquedivisa GSE-PSE-MK23-08B]|jgi:hypothetical protein|nr:DUF192 domain-containing protein [Timaviella obliquedivisa GSE-PSE-MK23-08B]